MKKLTTLITALFISFSPLCAEDTQSINAARAVSKGFTQVAKKAIPAVVYLKAESEEGQQLDFPYGGGRGLDPFSDEDFPNFFFGHPYGRNKPRKPERSLSQGSGFFVSSDGLIMTSAHVVKGADKITVVLHDGRELVASAIGADPKTDVAILKVEGEGFPYLEFADSDSLEIAEIVMAIGSPFQLHASVTVGVVSAKGRQDLQITDQEDFIQTDAAINPGNSGGPLLDLDGKVVGINTAIVSKTGGYMGIGFSASSNMARKIMEQLVEKGTVTRGFLGVSLQPIDKDLADAFNLAKPEGALVSEVMKNSPAEKAGLKQGDIVIEYDGTQVKSLGSFRNDISLKPPGTEMKLKVNRKGEILVFAVTLTAAQDNSIATGMLSTLGFEVENLSAELAKQLNFDLATTEGVVITKVRPGSPAAALGLRPGFLIIAINHKKVTNVNDFSEAISDLGKQKKLLILVKQGNLTRFYSLKLG